EAGRTLEDLANRRGTEVAIRVASLVTSYLRERRHEAEALAHSPAILVAAQEASQKSAGQGLDRLDVPALERQFSRTRQLGGDPGARSAAASGRGDGGLRARQAGDPARRRRPRRRRLSPRGGRARPPAGRAGPVPAAAARARRQAHSAPGPAADGRGPDCARG